MNKTELEKGVISIEDVQQRIIQVREQPVIIDADVACLYEVATKRVNEAVRNNPEKFPGDYMFELDDNESRVLRSKISTLEHVGKGRHSKYNFKAFTEKGLYMLATVLKSNRVPNEARVLTHGGALGRSRPLRGFATLGEANTPSYARPSAHPC